MHIEPLVADGNRPRLIPADRVIFPGRRVPRHPLG